MENKEKKKYEKPQVTRIKLDAECAVLGFCKTSGTIGPGLPACDFAVGCATQGS